MVGLQHRGQEGAGLVSVAQTKSGGNEFKLHRGHGLVTDVFKPEDMEALGGIHAVGHTRYSTAGGKNQIHSRPTILCRRFVTWNTERAKQ